MDRWDGGNAYDTFMGRWSQETARHFVEGLDIATGQRWLDVGCGTGALLGTIAERSSPSRLAGVDPSRAFVDVAADRLGRAADVHVATGEHLPFEDSSFDAVVSGLALNFMPDPAAALVEWTRVAVNGATVAAYVWDYANGMGFLRAFWDAAVSLDASARHLDEGGRFPICEPNALRSLFEGSELASVEVGHIDIPTVFEDFDGYWSPFLLGQGPAPAYVAGLDESARQRLRDELHHRLVSGGIEEIALGARAWTVRGRVRDIR